MKTFIFGASGHAREILCLINDINKSYDDKLIVKNFVVPDGNLSIGMSFNKIKIIAESDYLNKYTAKRHNCILAIGSSKLREIIHNKIKSTNTIFPVLIHPTVLYDKDTTTFKEGGIICSNVILTTNINIGKFVHINISSTISHDCQINEFSTISPGVKIAGNVTLGGSVFMGIGSVVIENINICNNTIIGAGAVVTKSINEIGTYVGIPAKKIK